MAPEWPQTGKKCDISHGKVCTIEAEERTGLDRSRAALDVVNRCISPADGAAASGVSDMIRTAVY